MSHMFLKRRNRVAPSTKKQKALHRKIKIRFTHPTLYYSVMAHCIICAGLALNFWNANPTFDPFGFSKIFVGFIFITFGGFLFVFLNLLHDLRMVRRSLLFLFIWYFVWGFANAEQWHNGKASLQLPIVFIGLSSWAFILLTTSAIDIITEVKDE